MKLAYHLSRSAIGGRKARLGRLDCVRAGVAKSLDTPGLLTYTRCGVAPYITLDLAKQLPFDALAFTCGPLNGLFQSQETFDSTSLRPELGVRDMIGGSDGVDRPHFFLSTVADQAGGYLPGLNRGDGVSVFLVGGKMLVNLKDQFGLLRRVKPDAFQVLCDADTEKSCPKKRLEKSYARSVSYLNDTMTTLNGETNGLSGVGAFASLVGGYNDQIRAKFANDVKQVDHLVSGYVIDSLHYGGATSLEFDLASPEFVQLFDASLAPLSQDKPRYLPGCFTPSQMASAVLHLGVDLFDSSYAYHLAEQGQALLFDRKLAAATPAGDDFAGKTCKVVDFKQNKSVLMADFTPMDATCQCYACSKPFTRGYLCHLIAVDEILGQILLMIHNLTVQWDFLAGLRAALRKIEN